jgi:hypothetical protein
MLKKSDLKQSLKVSITLKLKLNEFSNEITWQDKI